MPASRVAGAALALVSLGCSAGWSRRPIETLDPAAARQQVQVWHAGRASLLHGVRVDSATVSGIPYHKPLTCDSCVVVIPRAEVDSVRIGDLSNGLWRSMALGLAVLGVATFVYCLQHDCGGT